MSKNINHKGKQSHCSKNQDRSKYWKYGKSSGKQNNKGNK